MTKDDTQQSAYTHAYTHALAPAHTLTGPDTQNNNNNNNKSKIS